MDAYHGHAHLFSKDGVISRMSKKQGVHVGHKALFESMFVSQNVSNDHQFFSLACMTNSRYHGKLFRFSTHFAVFEVFLAKKVDKWLNVATSIRSQKSFKFGTGAYHGHAHMLAEVGVISRMLKNRSC